MDSDQHLAQSQAGEHSLTPITPGTPDGGSTGTRFTTARRVTGFGVGALALGAALAGCSNPFETPKAHAEQPTGTVTPDATGAAGAETPTTTEQQKEKDAAMQVAKDWLSGKNDEYIQLLEGQPFMKDLGKLYNSSHNVILAPIYQTESSHGDLRIAFLGLGPHGEHIIVVLTGGDNTVLADNGGLSSLGFTSGNINMNPQTFAVSGGSTDSHSHTVSDAINILQGHEALNQKIAEAAFPNVYYDPSQSPDPTITRENNAHGGALSLFLGYEQGKIPVDQTSCIATNLDQLTNLLTKSDPSSLPLTHEVDFVS